jgi:hypothetical protein
MSTNLCLICDTEATIDLNPKDGRLMFYIDCPHCTRYKIDSNDTGYLKDQLKSDMDVAILSHAIYKMQRSAEIPLLSQSNIALILQNPLPRPVEQMNNFVIWLGDNIPGLGEEVTINSLVMRSIIGTRTQKGVGAIIDYLVEKKFVNLREVITMRDEPQQWKLKMKMEGWEYYENLKQGSTTSRKAFMAMQYNNKELDEIVERYFRPAVKAAGYDLYRLDDIHKAGLIDDRLKVEIRTSRFLIADLTHENRGAYWEAGFAQGLGKPVIYTCEASKFDEQYTHFDTNHHTTIKWDRNNLEKAATDLKNTIRETLPEEAKLVDDE